MFQEGTIEEILTDVTTIAEIVLETTIEIGTETETVGLHHEIVTTAAVLDGTRQIEIEDHMIETDHRLEGKFHSMNLKIVNLMNCRGPSPFRRPGMLHALFGCTLIDLVMSSGPGPPRRDSRSPPRRRYSPSPPPRSKYRSRSRSPRRLSPPPYRRVRLGNHSIEPSSRPRSPYRRPHSRDRSLSPSKRTGNVESPHRREPEHIETKPPMPSASKTNDAMEVGPVGAKPELKVEQQDSELPSSDIKPSVESPATIEAGEIEAEEIQNTNMEKKESEHMQVDALEELPAALIVTPSAVPPLTLEPHIIVANVAVPERKIERDEKKMDVVEPSPTKPLPSAPASSQARYTPPRSPPHYDQRAIPTGPQRNRRSPPPSRPRSPPRAPRNHPRPITTQNSSSSSSYPLREYPPREPRRNYQQEPAFSSPVSAKVDHDLRLPKIPRYQAPRHMAELELEVCVTFWYRC